jgi:hypothetical protein
MNVLSEELCEFLGISVYRYDIKEMFYKKCATRDTPGQLYKILSSALKELDNG